MRSSRPSRVRLITARSPHRTRSCRSSRAAGRRATRPPPTPIAAAPYAAARRAAVSAAFPGERLVIPAGGFKVRSNDTDYRFRPHSAFAHLTGLGTDREPDAVLVLEPRDERDGGGHEPVIYFRPRAERDSKEFFGDARYGEFWVGVRPSLAEVEAELGDQRPAHRRADRRHHEGPRGSSACGSSGTPTPTWPSWSTRPGPRPSRRRGRERHRVGGRGRGLLRGRNPSSATRFRPTSSWPGSCPSCGWSRTSSRSSRCGWPSRPRSRASRRSPRPCPTPSPRAAASAGSRASSS